MENDHYLPQVDFQIAVNSFHDQLINKLQQFNIIEIELLRKFQCSINIPQAHPELIFYLRNMIHFIEQMFKDVQSYFSDLRMTFLYDYFRKVQMLMVNGFNFISQALVIQLDQNERDRDCLAKQKEKQKMIIRNKIFHSSNVKDLEHCDYTINFYQNEEMKIAEELHRMQENILMSKGLVDKLHPSKAVKQLLEIKQRAELTLQNTQKIFQETYQLKYLQFKQHLSKLKRPQDVTKQFCDNIKVSMKDKFEVGMKKSVNMLYHLKREEELKNHINIQAQTDDVQIVSAAKKERQNVFKNGEKIMNLLFKEKRLTQKLQLQIQMARKDAQVYLADKQKLKALCKQFQIKYKEYHYNYDVLSKMYDEKRDELNDLRKQLGDNEVLINRLRAYERRFFKQHSLVENCTQTVLKQCKQVETQANFEDNQYIHILKKTNEKIIQKLREKEIRFKQFQKKLITEQITKRSKFRISHDISSEVFAGVDKEDQSFESHRSSISSQKSVFKIKLQQKLEPKCEPTIRSRFSIKRASNKNMTMSRQKKTTEYSVQVNLPQQTTNIVESSQKSIQVQLDPPKVQTYQKPQQFTMREAKKKNKTQFKLRQQAFQILTQRKQERNPLKINQKILQRQSMKRQDRLPQLNQEEYYYPLDQDQPVQRLQQRSQEKQQCYLFQYLNIQSEESKNTMQKKNNLSKNLIQNIKRKERNIEQSEDKNKTCIGQYNKKGENAQSSHLICVDKLQINKKRKGYTRRSVNAKKSTKEVRYKENIDNTIE